LSHYYINTKQLHNHILLRQPVEDCAIEVLICYLKFIRFDGVIPAG